MECVIEYQSKQNEMWLSLVERHVRDVEAAGSNPVISTNKEKGRLVLPFSLFFEHHGFEPLKCEAFDQFAP